MSHPLKNPLPCNLQIDRDGVISCKDGRDFREYVASVYAQHIPPGAPPMDVVVLDRKGAIA